MGNASILTQITAANTTNTLAIYQPTVGYSGYITTLKATINIKSIAASNFPYIPDSTPPEAVEAILTQLSEELEYKEISLKLKKGSGSWIEKNKIRLFNKDPYYEIDLMSYLTDSNTVDVAEDLQIGLQMITTLGADDSVVVFGFVVEEKKTNDVELLAAKVEALELALYGKLTNLPANSLVGSVAGGVAAGTINLPLATNLGGTGTAGAAGGSFGSTDIKGKKGTWAGIGFPDAYGAPIFMQNDSSFFNGMWSNSSSHPAKWMWWYQDGQFKVFGDAAIQGTFISLDKGLGSLPGYATSRYPTVKTDFDACYISVAGQFSAQITANGVYTAISDFNKKENIRELDYQDTLEKIKYLPVCEYSFKNSDSRIKSISTFAQAFWLAFGLGGDIEILEEDSPTQPNKMMATSDVSGVCLAGIKGLIERVENLEHSLILDTHQVLESDRTK